MSTNNKLKNINYEDLKDDLIAITGLDKDSDEQLKVAYKLSSKKIYSIVAGQEVNKERFESIVEVALFEMTVYRFNRISEEGMSSLSQDGESINWEKDPFGDFEQRLKDTIEKKYSNGWNLEWSGTPLNNNRLPSYEYVVPILSNMYWYYDSNLEV